MIYLNYAALCPTRMEAQQEVDSTMAEFKSLLYSEAGLCWYEKKVAEGRCDVASLLGASDPSSIAFVQSASMASHLALSFIDWEAGDVILTSAHENPSVMREIEWLNHRGVQFLTIKPTSLDEFLTTIKDHIATQHVKAIMMSHVSHVDGRIFPIEAMGRMAKDHGLLFCVDGAQAVGHISVNLSQLDFDLYFFPGHKWCQGPLGTGALIMQESFVTKNPAFAQAGLGWNGTPAGRFEIGTHNIGLAAGLAKACKLLKQEGLKLNEQEEIRNTAKMELEAFADVHVQEWAGDQAPGILTFRCRDPKNHKRITNLLQNELGMVVKQFLDYPAGETPAIRLSWSGEKDRENVSSAVQAIQKNLMRLQRKGSTIAPK